MALTLDDLFVSPNHYLHSFDGDAAVFVPMDRVAYHRSIFLDQRISPAGSETMRLPVAALPVPPRAPAPIGWIFHVAHCGSTLLARALDQIATNLVLREPLALRQAAVAPDARRLALVLAMLSKRYDADAPTIVKANVPVNFMLAEIAAASPASHAILLYCQLGDYLLAILRSDEHRAWLRRVIGQLARYFGDLATLSDAERAAALWLAQMRAFTGALDGMPHARSLDAEAFFAAPVEMVALAARHLGVPMAEDAIERLVDGPLFQTYSKNPAVAFDNAARLARREEVKRRLGDEIAQAEAWITRAAGDIALMPARLAAARL